MILEWPQITVIVLTAIGLGVALAVHDKPREGNHNFFLRSGKAIVLIWLLYMGGFWT